MNTEDILAQFREIYELEKIARDIYNGILSAAKDPEVRSVVKSIRDDEIRHMRLAKRAISILDSEPGR